MKSKVLEIEHFIKSKEQIIFYLVLLLYLVPVFQYKYFPTVDGPTHLYNAKLIVELLSDVNSQLHDYFVFNNSLNPNWTGHFLLSVFVSFLPAFIAEKIILLFYIIGLPLAIRFLFKVLNIKNFYLLYLVFPFTYSFLFYYGFYNFNIAVVLLFLGMAYWYKFYLKLNIKRFFIILIISTLICLSHLFVFAIYIAVILFINISNLIANKNLYQGKFRRLLKLILLQFFALSLGIIIATNFFVSAGIQNNDSVYLGVPRIFQLIYEVSPAKGINYAKANIYSQWMFLVFAILLINILVKFIYAIIRKERFKLSNPLCLFLVLFILILVFIIPDSKGISVGLNTHRLLLLFFLFFIIWISFQKVSRWFKMGILIILAYVNISFVLFNCKSIEDVSIISNEIVIASGKIEKNSLVLPINNSDLLLTSHIANYIGVNKPMIIIDNYEVGLDHFPLKWNCNNMPILKFGDYPIERFCSNNSIVSKENTIDYIVLINDKESIYKTENRDIMRECLNQNYELVYEAENKIIMIFSYNE